MPLWLSITIAVACWLRALIQIRMSLIYSGKIDSPAIGFYKGQGTNPWLTSVAIRSAIAWVVFGVFFLLFKWPHVLTYTVGAWAIFTIVDLVLFFLGTGLYSADMSIVTPQGRKAIVVEQVSKALGMLAFKGVLFAAFAYFLGF